MKDEQRIKEIEWRREDVLAEWLSPTPPGDEGQLIDNDIPWLIAYNRELEAQVKRGAAVIDAAREWAKARNAVQTETGNIGTDWRKTGYDWKAVIARAARAEARAKKAEHNLRVAIDALATPKGIEEE